MQVVVILRLIAVLTVVAGALIIFSASNSYGGLQAFDLVTGLSLIAGAIVPVAMAQALERLERIANQIAPISPEAIKAAQSARNVPDYVKQ